MEDTETNGLSGSETPDAKKPGQSQTTCHGVNGYEIRVRDHLEIYWHKWFEGWSVTNLDDGEVLLKSTDVDQSKLHGALNKIRDLNLTLLAVRCISADDETTSSGERGEQNPKSIHRKNTK
jgi:hypothetical protein